jgi:hypothetical protein
MVLPHHTQSEDDISHVKKNIIQKYKIYKYKYKEMKEKE